MMCFTGAPIDASECYVNKTYYVYKTASLQKEAMRTQV